MSAEDKDLVRRFYAGLDRHDFGVYEELCTPDFRSHFPGTSASQTREERERISRDFYEAFPDLLHTIEDLVAEGGRVAARISVTGTNTGSFQGRKPIGRRVRFSAMRFYTVVDGRLAEEWAEFDSLGLFNQLGGVR